MSSLGNMNSDSFVHSGIQTSQHCGIKRARTPSNDIDFFSTHAGRELLNAPRKKLHHEFDYGHPDSKSKSNFEEHNGSFSTDA